MAIRYSSTIAVYMTRGSICFLIVLVLMTIFGPFLSPYEPYAQNLELGAVAPSYQHWLGTDIFGRDQLTRILFGGRVSLMIGAVASCVALVIGVSWGGIAGYVGGRTDSVMMRIVDVFYALPFTLFVILIMVVFGRSLIVLLFAIAAVEWLTMSRIIRGQVSAMKQREFIAAAITMGLPLSRILIYHVLPNLMGPILVYMALIIPNVILLESFLSFLGLGIQAPQSSWGSLIAQGVESMEEFPWLLIYPVLVFGSTLVSLNVLAQHLRSTFSDKCIQE